MEKKTNLILSASLFFISLLLSAYSNSNREVAKFGGQFLTTIASPLSNSFVYLKSNLGNSLENYLFLLNTKAENQALQEQVKFLQSENARFRESEIENKRLHQILKFAVVTQQTGLVANVIGYSNRSQQQTILVNRGSQDGVRLKQVAVDGVAVIGQVIEVNSRSSKILLISDPLSGVDSVSQETRVRGVVQGLNENLLQWKYIPKEENIQIGGRIITSGADGIFPHGLLVGVVIQVKDNLPGMFHEIVIKPATNLDRIETVYLLNSSNHEN